MKIYVTGGTGFVGSNILKVAVERHRADVFATVNKRQLIPPVAYAYDTVDMCDRDQVMSTVRAYRPDAIVHCAILSGVERWYYERELSWQSYVDATRYLTEAANEVGAKMILISTDWVFDGTQGPAAESTPPNPINYYGVLKVVGENLLATMGDNWAVARVAGVNGVHWARPELPLEQNVGLGNLMTAVVAALGQNEPFDVWEGDINMRGTATLATEIGEMVMKIIALDRRGIFHCCGGESATRHELAVATAEGFGFDPGLIRSRSYTLADQGVPSAFRVPSDSRLRAVFTAEQLAHPLSNLSEAVEELRRQVQTQTI